MSRKVVIFWIFTAFLLLDQARATQVPSSSGFNWPVDPPHAKLSRETGEAGGEILAYVTNKTPEFMPKYTADYVKRQAKKY